MNAYSKDLRLKVLSAVDRGVPRKEVSHLFGVSRSTLKRWLGRRRHTGGVDVRLIPGRTAELRTNRRSPQGIQDNTPSSMPA